MANSNSMVHMGKWIDLGQRTPLTDTDKCRHTPLHTAKTAILDQLVIQIPITRTSRVSTADLPPMASNSHPIEGTILLIEEVIFSILLIDAFLVLALVLSNNSLLPLEVVVVISATYNGPHQVLNEAAHKARISIQANRTPYTPLRPCLTEDRKNRSPTLMMMMMTIPFDLQKICKWRMKRRRTRWLHQEDSRVMTTNQKMLRNSPLHSNRKHPLQLQLSLHQIYQPG